MPFGSKPFDVALNYEHLKFGDKRLKRRASSFSLISLLSSVVNNIL